MLCSTSRRLRELEVDLTRKQRVTRIGSVTPVGNMMLRNNVIPSCTASYGCGGSSEVWSIYVCQASQILLLDTDSWGFMDLIDTRL